METSGWPRVDPNRVQLYDSNAPFRMPISHTLSHPGTPVALMGKVESGSVKVGCSLLIMPNKVQVKVVSVLIADGDGDDVGTATAGVNLQVPVSGILEEDILSGSVLCSLEKPIAAVHTFTAKLFVVELVDNIIIMDGFRAVLHIHSAVEECEILELMQLIDPKTGKPIEKKMLFAKRGNVCICRIQVPNLLSMEKYSDSQQLGRFTLRSHGTTVALGKVTELA